MPKTYYCMLHKMILQYPLKVKCINCNKRITIKSRIGIRRIRNLELELRSCRKF
jgi:hypothetical protein